MVRLVGSAVERLVRLTLRFTKLKSLLRALMLILQLGMTTFRTKKNCLPQALIQVNSSRVHAT